MVFGVKITLRFKVWLEQSTDKAIEYLTLAAEQGNEDAMELLKEIGQ